MVIENNRRIARNTIMLYIRMLAITLISLYTVRITLQVLGADDYGIYNAVAGVIGFLSFISVTLSNSAQRFLAFDLGKNNILNYQHTFSMLMIVFVVIAIIITVIAELIGPLLIEKYLVIPKNRISAAHWVFQISLLSLLIRFVTIPFTASIVAHERMSFYAYLSIAEVVLKLIIVFVIINSTFDKLIIYALLLFLMDVIVSSINIYICSRRWHYCRPLLYWNKSRFSELGRYIGWNTFGSLSALTETQLITVILNHFFAPVIVTAKAIADKIQNVAFSLVSNFVLASSPQLVKYYSVGDNKEFSRLFYRTSKVSFYLMTIICAPLFLLMPFLLKLWLGSGFAEEMIIFARMAIVVAIINSLETPISRAVIATGKIKLYEIINCLASILGLPIIYLILVKGGQAYWCYVVYSIITLLSLIYRIAILSQNSSVRPFEYIKHVALPVSSVLVSVIMMNWLLYSIETELLWQIILIRGGLSLIVSLIIVFYIGFQKNERVIITNFFISKIRRINNNVFNN